MKSQKGIILVATLIILLVLTILTMGFHSIVSTNIFITSSFLDSAQAFCIAEAGMAYAFQYEEDISDSMEFGGGTCEYIVELDEDNVRTITSIGKFEDSQITISMIVDGEDNITSWQEGY